MTDMKKDAIIENSFRSYFAGVEMPQIDLTAAKRALEESCASNQRRSKKTRAKRRAIFGAAFSALAVCLALIVALVVVFMPVQYSYEEAFAQSATYSDLKETYGDKLGGLSAFSLSDNATAEYTLYSTDGKEVLLRADVAVLSGTNKLTGTVWLDLSAGKYRATELEEYTSLSNEKSGYVYETEYLNGEYVSRAFYKSEGVRYYVDVTSPNDRALAFMMEVLRG